MPKIISGYHFDTGTRELYEDRVRAGSIKRANGDLLDYAIVADGVGGENNGERAAQLALDATIVYLQNGLEKSIPALLSKALHSANHEVFWSTKSNKGTSTTLTVAVILNGQTLYIANVGDSEAYLVRGSKVSKLTLDHSFKNIIPIQDKMSREAAASSPRANVLMHAIGLEETVPVDIGFHIKDDLTEQEYKKAQLRGKKGLPIKKGDTVIVCSDGLTGLSPTDGRPLIQDEEILQVVSAQEGNRAARGLVSFALGRDADDNVSVALLQTDDPDRKEKAVNRQQQIRKNAALFYGGIALATIALFSVIAFFFFQGRSTETLNAEQTRIALVQNQTATYNAFLQETRDANDAQLAAEATAIRATADQRDLNGQLAIQQTETVSAIIAATQTAQPTATPLPTSTPRPTLIPGQIGFFRGKSQDDLQPLFEDEAVIAVENSEVQINHLDVEEEDASIYLSSGGEIEFSQVSRQVEFRIFEESNILVETGRYQSGAEAEVRATDNDVLFSVVGSCMGVNYSEQEELIVAACFEGECDFRIDRDDTVSIPTGDLVTLNPADLSLEPQFSPIPPNLAVNYRTLLSDFPGGLLDVPQCLQPYLPVPPTPTPTPTISLPTETPTPVEVDSGGGNNGGGNSGGGNNGGGGGGSQNTPVPPPTAAPPPTESAPQRPTAVPERPTAAP